MASDVKFSLASAFSDLNPARRAEPKNADAASAPGNSGAGDAAFKRLVSDEAAVANAASNARSHQASRRAERSMPGRVTQPEHREAPEAPEKKDSREPAVQAEKPRPEVAGKHESAKCIGPADGDQGEGPVEPCLPKAPDGQDDERVVCIGAAPQPDTALTDGPVIGPVPDQSLLEGDVVIETILPEGVLPGMTAALPTPVTADITGGSAADPAAVVAGIAALVGKTGEAAKLEEAAKTAELVAASEEVDQAGEADLLEAARQKTAGNAASGAGGSENSVGKIADGKTADGKLSEGTTTGIAKAEPGDRLEAVANKSTAPNLHPSRASHFADILEGFGASNAIHRPADILAGLDRSVAAQALNRGAEVSRPTPLQMLPIEIGMQAVRGVTNFQIRLDPAELGRVDVKLQIHENGEVNASLVVDRVETLQMLRRDASTLQNAFEQAGLKQSPDGLSFSLRGEGQQGQQQEQRARNNSSDTLDEVALQAQIGDAVMRRVLVPNSSIDRMV